MPLTRGERTDLLSVARKREKVAKTQIDARAAALRADFERQMASEYAYNDDPTWEAAVKAAAEAMETADAAIKERCKELGIPMEYRPGVGITWVGRGQNGVAQRQAELRRVAASRIKEVSESAKHAIEAAAADVQEKILTLGMASEAREVLAGMPTPEQLMPMLDVIELENAVQRPALGRGGGFL